MNALRSGSFYPALLTANNRDAGGCWLPVPEPFTVDDG
jgi:hypothetical protein